MSFHNWLQKLRSARTPSGSKRHHGRRASHRAASHRPHLEILEDRLTPSFEPAVAYPVGPDPVAVATADLNNDGHLDLATANTGDATISVLLGDGQGGFGAARNFATGASPWSLAAGDFDGDGKLDLATPSGPGRRYVSVLLGNGDGTFRSAVTTYNPLEGALTSIAPVPADFDADGKTDLAFVLYNYSQSEPTHVGVLLNYGPWGFAGRTSYPNSGSVSAVAVADVNADSKADVVMAGTYYDYANDEWTTLGYVNVWRNQNPSTYWTSPSPQGLAVGDFTRDDVPDLVIAGQTLDVLPGVGNGYFGSPISNPASSVVGVADFNGDGKLDIDSGGSVLLGLGDGTFTEPYAAPTAPTVGDFNGDGLPDVAYVDSNAVWVRLNDGVWPPVPQVPAIRIGNATVTEGNTGAASTTFTVSLSEASTETVTIDYGTADWSATVSSDYEAASGALTFAPGETSKTVTVRVNGDRNGEDDESFFVNLSGATNATISDGQGVGTIVEDEPRITTNYSTNGTEGNTGPTPFAFTVILSSAYDVPVTVDWTTADGTATAGSDYQAASGTLTIPVGQTTGTITVLVNSDRLPESNETFYVNLSAPTHARILFGFSEGTILDDEPRISISDVTKAEGKKGQTTLLTFTVTLSAAYDQAVTMSFRTVNSTATTGNNDYIARTGTLTFAPGETAKTITIEAKGDSKKEANETFYLDLFGLSSNALFTKNRGLGTILNDD